MKPAKPLAEDIAIIVESPTSAKYGVILVSFGTLYSKLDEGRTNKLAKAFSKLQQTVIWRHTGETPAGLRLYLMSNGVL